MYLLAITGHYINLMYLIHKFKDIIYDKVYVYTCIYTYKEWGLTLLAPTP